MNTELAEVLVYLQTNRINHIVKYAYGGDEIPVIIIIYDQWRDKCMYVIDYDYISGEFGITGNDNFEDHTKKGRALIHILEERSDWINCYTTPVGSPS